MEIYVHINYFKTPFVQLCFPHGNQSGEGIDRRQFHVHNKLVHCLNFEKIIQAASNVECRIAKRLISIQDKFSEDLCSIDKFAG